MARSFWETACQPNPGRFRPHSLPWMAGAAARGRCSSHARRRAVAARSPLCCYGKFVAVAAQARIINKFIWTGQQQPQAT
jgi:hypothetical protein